ncbi:MAG TPA: sensor histidine kinase [Pseudosphingobacterium sp.]|nr:sensor histidine kinase [Pseudosphingobacterium sp.]
MTDIKRFYGVYLCLLLLLLSGNGRAQNINDSLNNELKKKHLKPGEKVMIMGKLAHRLYFLNQEKKADSLMRLALLTANTIKDGQYSAYIYAIKAFQSRITEKDKMITKKLLDSATFFANRTSNNTIKGYVFYCSGWIDSRNGKPNEAIKFFLKGLELLDKGHTLQDLKYKANVYSELAAIYSEWEDTENFGKYVRLGLSNALESHDIDNKASSQQMLASYFEQRYLKDSTNRTLLDSALYYNKQAIATIQNNKEQIRLLSQLPFTAMNVANLYAQHFPSSYRDSIHIYLNIALQKGIETKQYTVVANSYGMMSDLALAENKLDKAENLLNKAAGVIMQDNMPDQHTLSQVFLNLSKIAERKKNYRSALQYYKQHSEVHQSIFDAEKMRIGKSLAARYEAEKKEQQLAAMQHKIIFSKKLNTVYFVLAITFLFALLLLYYAYIQRNKTLKQRELVHQLEIEKINQEHQISLLSAMLEGQESERSRLARDLHDGLGGLISGIKLDLAERTNSLTEQASKSMFTPVLKHIDYAIHELRRIAHSMMPELLLKAGLSEAFKEYCRNLKKEHFEVICQVFNFKGMDKEREVVLYRIMQELLTNVVKHAQAKTVLVQLQQSDGLISLTVEDDGIGFDVNDEKNKQGAGWKNIQSRVQYLKGSIEIYSEPEKGTTVTIECKSSEKKREKIALTP